MQIKNFKVGFIEKILVCSRSAQKCSSTRESVSSMRAKVLLTCARSAQKNCYYAREARKSIASMRAKRAKAFLECAQSAQSYCIYASESITKMRAKRAKHAKSLLVCALSARKYCWSACESTSVLRAKRAKVLLVYSCLFNSCRIYKVGVEEQTHLRILFYCIRTDKHSE